MSKALIAGINQVASDKGLDREVIFSAIEVALISAYKRNYGSVANVTSEVDRVTGEMKIFAEREVVDEVYNEHTEIELEAAKKLVPDTEIGAVINVQTTPKDFGRIAAQTAKQVILQRIREAERDTVFENFVHKVNEIINAQVRSVDQGSGSVTVSLGDKHESLLMREEQIPSENLRRGDYVRLYVVDVHRSNKGPVIKLSRTHRNLLRRLMEQEVPEVRDGTVEIKAIAREPGARSKVAVFATSPDVDPVGACVGQRGNRIQPIVNELAGEKIDVVQWDSNLQIYIANALSPATVQSVILDDGGSVKTALVVVPDRQLSLAIGKEGQNARLAAKLTGWRIDIKSETEAKEEGLDLLAAQQAPLPTSRQDLLSVAERILQGGDRVDDEREDRFRKAAEAVQQKEPKESDFDFVEVEKTTWPGDLDVLEQQQSEEDRLAAMDAFERAAATISQEPILPPTFDGLDLDEEEEEMTFPAPELPATPARPAAEADEESGPEMVEPEALPEIITADMLRERMAQRQSQKMDLGSLDDIEVPEELLVGLDVEEDAEEEEEWDEEKGKAKRGKAAPRKPQAKKGKAKRTPKRRFDEFDSDFDY
jgi:N utilization substance protein A